jgi:molecular chaperone GrpE (heat shock protein)
MSDIGLYGSVYEQLRTYADRLDRALIALRNPQADVAQKARLKIVDLLREILDRNSTNPATRFVAIILKQELRTTAGQGLSLCDALAKALEQHSPNQSELNQLEQIAMALDKECSNSLARIKGKR